MVAPDEVHVRSAEASPCGSPPRPGSQLQLPLADVDQAPHPHGGVHPDEMLAYCPMGNVPPPDLEVQSWPSTVERV